MVSSFLLVNLPPCSKDVRIPREMQRAMAAEAEATREARAKVGRLKPSLSPSVVEY